MKLDVGKKLGRKDEGKKGEGEKIEEGVDKKEAG